MIIEAGSEILNIDYMNIRLTQFKAVSKKKSNQLFGPSQQPALNKQEVRVLVTI